LTDTSELLYSKMVKSQSVYEYTSDFILPYIYILHNIVNFILVGKF